MTDLELGPKILTEDPLRKRLAGCFIFDEQGRVILLRRNTPDRIQLELPGGKVGWDELPADAAKREMLEELGIEVEIVEFAGSAGFKETDNADNEISYDYNWFVAKIKSGEPTPNEAIFNQVKYWSWEELQDTQEPISLNLANILEARKMGKLDFLSQSS